MIWIILLVLLLACVYFYMPKMLEKVEKKAKENAKK